VQPCGHLRTSPTDNEDLFERIRASDGALVWPFRPDTKPMNGHFLRRNRFLVALSEAVVIVDAGFPSGTLNAAKWATDLGRPVYAVPPEWGAGKESGLLVAIERGARPLWSIQTLLTEMRLVATDEPPTDEVEPEEKEVLAAVLSTPEHVDSIAFRAGLTAELVATSLLTLSLKNVVVEGPPGFFRRAFAS
jgi:DNA processing protein